MLSDDDHDSVLRLSILPVTAAPTFDTSPSRRPNRSLASARDWSTTSSCVQSPETATTLSAPAATASRPARSRSTATTLAPRPLSLRAASLPMPEAAPVTM